MFGRPWGEGRKALRPKVLIFDDDEVWSLIEDQVAQHRLLCCHYFLVPGPNNKHYNIVNVAFRYVRVTDFSFMSQSSLLYEKPYTVIKLVNVHKCEDFKATRLQLDSWVERVKDEFDYLIVLVNPTIIQKAPLAMDQREPQRGKMMIGLFRRKTPWEEAVKKTSELEAKLKERYKCRVMTFGSAPEMLKEVSDLVFTTLRKRLQDCTTEADQIFSQWKTGAPSLGRYLSTLTDGIFLYLQFAIYREATSLCQRIDEIFEFLIDKSFAAQKQCFGDSIIMEDDQVVPIGSINKLLDININEFWKSLAQGPINELQVRFCLLYLRANVCILKHRGGSLSFAELLTYFTNTWLPHVKSVLSQRGLSKPALTLLEMAAYLSLGRELCCFLRIHPTEITTQHSQEVGVASPFDMSVTWNAFKTSDGDLPEVPEAHGSSMRSVSPPLPPREGSRSSVAFMPQTPTSPSQASVPQKTPSATFDAVSLPCPSAASPRHPDEPEGTPLEGRASPAFTSTSEKEWCKDTPAIKSILHIIGDMFCYARAAFLELGKLHDLVPHQNPPEKIERERAPTDIVVPNHAPVEDVAAPLRLQPLLSFQHFIQYYLSLSAEMLFFYKKAKKFNLFCALQHSYVPSLMAEGYIFQARLALEMQVAHFDSIKWSKLAYQGYQRLLLCQSLDTSRDGVIGWVRTALALTVNEHCHTREALWLALCDKLKLLGESVAAPFHPTIHISSISKVSCENGLLTLAVTGRASIPTQSTMVVSLQLKLLSSRHPTPHESLLCLASDPYEYTPPADGSLPGDFHVHVKGETLECGTFHLSQVTVDVDGLVFTLSDSNISEAIEPEAVAGAKTVIEAQESLVELSFRPVPPHTFGSPIALTIDITFPTNLTWLPPVYFQGSDGEASPMPVSNMTVQGSEVPESGFDYSEINVPPMGCIGLLLIDISDTPSDSSPSSSPSPTPNWDAIADAGFNGYEKVRRTGYGAVCIPSPSDTSLVVLDGKLQLKHHQTLVGDKVLRLVYAASPGWSEGARGGMEKSVVAVEFPLTFASRTVTASFVHIHPWVQDEGPILASCSSKVAFDFPFRTSSHVNTDDERAHIQVALDQQLPLEVEVYDIELLLPPNSPYTITRRPSARYTEGKKLRKDQSLSYMFTLTAEKSCFTGGRLADNPCLCRPKLKYREAGGDPTKFNTFFGPVVRWVPPKPFRYICTVRMPMVNETIPVLRVGEPVTFSITIDAADGAGDKPVQLWCFISTHHWMVSGGSRKKIEVSKDAPSAITIVLTPMRVGHINSPTVKLVESTGTRHDVLPVKLRNNHNRVLVVE